MKIYLVGGAIRDRLLGRAVEECDYLVVGATPEQMKKLGYLLVGKDFPVFLHPVSRAEYALARAPRSLSGDNDAKPSPQVTLEEDLARRDLTINAMAETEEGRLIDPFGGKRDLESRILRHVSSAFSEDPIRVLRIARFMARYRAFGFQVAPETLSLMQGMVEGGLLDNLVPERVWREIQGALATPDPVPFFETLRRCGALARVLPELERLWGVPQPARWHPEIDCGLHSMLVLRSACALSESLEVRFAALTHDIGKGLTPREQWPSHPGHEERGARLIEGMSQRLRVPNAFGKLARLSARYHSHCHRLAELRPNTILKVLEKMDAFRFPQRFADFLLVCKADFLGRRGFENREYPQARQFRDLFERARQVDRSSLSRIPQGRAVGEALHGLRLQAIRSGV